MSPRIQIDPDFGFSSYYSPQTHPHLHLGNQSIKQLINQSIGSLPDTLNLSLTLRHQLIHQSINQPGLVQFSKFSHLLNQLIKKTPFTTPSPSGKKIKQKRGGRRGKKKEKRGRK